MPAAPQISVLVVTFDHADEIGACLGGLGLPGGSPPLLTPVRRVGPPRRS